ncbi:DUF2079 domain-containing protein [Kitasatospora kifunensis]|uniref:Putative membrane protein n=1 Tax=Kitasatospora kifunensis TaxID=58351 RepID=A0A7W7VV06_KITKI|nr:DUF2079 domain-containing protein [Kitasatospora kifunensis]MBB4923189.1 putative membrane protein [Kitasatospora kifunensis]
MTTFQLTPHPTSNRPAAPARSARPVRAGRLIPWLVVVAVTLFQLALAVPRQWRLQTAGFDLGIFEQVVRAYAGLHAPVTTLKGTGYSQLGDHFSPLLAVLAPIYRVFPTATTLLVVQALLLGLSVLPVTALALEVLGRRRAVAVGLAYGLSWGLWQLDQFDFHEVALAVPLVAWSVAALARGRWRAAVCWGLPLLLVKEDQGLVLAGIGALVFLLGRRRLLGTLTVAVAVLGTALIVLVLIPAANPHGVYDYAANGRWDGGNPITRLLLPMDKWHTVALLLGCTLFLALRSPLSLLLVLPMVGRFWTPAPIYWSASQQYNAVLMPILFVAMVDGLRRLRVGGLRRTGWARWTGWTGWIGARLVSLVPAAALALALLNAPVPDLSRPAPVVAAVHQTLAVIPDGAAVAASNNLAPQLTGRCTVSLFPYLTYPGQQGPIGRPVADWVAVFDRPQGFPTSPAQELDAIAQLTRVGYRSVARGGGVTVYHWVGAASPGLSPGLGQFSAGQS